MIPIVLLVAGGLVVSAQYLQESTAELIERDATRNTIVASALRLIRDPNQLRTLAISFTRQGRTHEANLLNNRVSFLEASTEVKAARLEVFQRGMQSKNKYAIKNLAAAFFKTGGYGMAKALLKRADSLSDDDTDDEGNTSIQEVSNA